MRWLFLGLGGFIFIESAKAYFQVGNDVMPGGGIAAILVFLMVQGFEAKPIIMTNGAASVFSAIGRVISKKRTTIHVADPEELLDASGWALLGYGIDFVCGLFVWPIMGTWALFWDLIGVGGVTWGDVIWQNLGMILACTFLLQEVCLRQYLVRGGRLPFAAKLGGPKNVRA